MIYPIFLHVFIVYLLLFSLTFCVAILHYMFMCVLGCLAILGQPLELQGINDPKTCPFPLDGILC